MNFDDALRPYVHLFAKKAFVLEPTLEANRETRTMVTLHGKFGVIFPYDDGGEVLGVDYLGYPRNPELTGRKLTSLEKRLAPYTLTFWRLTGEYQATFKKEHLMEVAAIVGIRRRSKRGFASRSKEVTANDPLAL